MLWGITLLKNSKNYKNSKNSRSLFTARKVSKYGVFSGLFYPLFRLNAGKYGPEKTPYLDIWTLFTQ